MYQFLKILNEFDDYLSILEYYGLFSVSLKANDNLFNLAITFVFDKKLDIVAMNYHLVGIPMHTVFLTVTLWLCKMKCVLPILWKLMVSVAFINQDSYLTNCVILSKRVITKLLGLDFVIFLNGNICPVKYMHLLTKTINISACSNLLQVNFFLAGL